MADFLTDLIRAFSPKPHLTPPDRDPHWDNDPTDLMNDIKQSDIVLYRVHSKDDFIGNIISKITSSPYSHSAFHIGGGYVIAADQGGIGYDDIFQGDVVIDLLRLNRPITIDEHAKMESLAKAQLNKPYDYWNLLDFTHLTQEQALQMSGGTSFICSELVAWLYKQIGVEIVKGKIITLEAPADLGLSDILDYVGTYVNGKKLPAGLVPGGVVGNYRNEFINDYKNVLSDFVASFMEMFSNTATFYAQLEKNKQLLVGKD
jgi:hypothetical protein